MKTNVIALVVALKRYRFIAPLALALTGCAVNHAPKAPLSQQSDREVCQSLGYAMANNSGARILDIKHELENREASHRLTISVEDCQIMLQDGVNMARSDRSATDAMLAGMAKSMEQQPRPAPRRMETTHCNSNYMGGFNCTTF
ncbi:hypothetical protein DCH27_25320 [Salmonella enterica]|nr:hypothetical protein [Salmonella enterica]